MLLGVFAQESDTIFLEEVKINSHEQYLTGMVSQAVDSTQNMHFIGNSLSELLQESTPVYLRHYGGEGQLSTISFRGTTPNHTRVNWNGIDVNSQTLGQSDFSSIPVYLFSDLRIYNGPSSVLFGSGAVGGTIDLQNPLIGSKGMNLEAVQQLGSYGKVFTGAKAGFYHSRWAVYLAAVRNVIDNDYEVAYRGTKYRQNNAQSKLHAIIAGLRLNTSSSSYFSINAWLNHHDRQVQPIIGDKNASDRLKDKSLRISAAYDHAFSAAYLNASMAYVKDEQTYNIGSFTNLERFIANATFEWTKWKIVEFKLGAKGTMVIPDVSSYADDIHQFRGAVYLLTSFRPLKRFSASLNVRQPFLSGISAPVVPSLGLEYQLLNETPYSVTAIGQVARSFRFPTLNEMYWQPGGDPNLKPEDGFTSELGLKAKIDISKISTTGQVTAYVSKLSEMIVWIVDGAFSYPRNVREVLIKGVETDLRFAGKMDKGQWHARANYAYNESLIQSALSSTDRSKGKQLAYVPLHKATMDLGASWNKWGVSYIQSYTGKRYTESTNTSSLGAFTLGDIEVNRNFQYRDHAFSLGFKVKNLWNTEYQNYERRATPGRNYLITLRYNKL